MFNFLVKKIAYGVSFFCFFFLFFTPFNYVHAGWYNSSWTYRIPITIDNTKVDADLTDFPVYVNLADLSADFHTNVKSDGGDIRVTKSDGTTEVPREVVFYDSSTDTGELHFKAGGTLSNTVDTVFYIYYGNSGASDYATTDIYGRNNVWTGYAMVLHLNEVVNNTSNGYADSTGNGNSGTGSSMALTEPNGKLSGKGQDFDGTLDHIATNYTGTPTDFTATVWFNADTDTLSKRILDKDYALGFWMGANTNGAPGGSNSWGGGVRESGAPYGRYVTLSTAGGWHHLVSRRSGTTHHIIGDGGAVSTSGTVSSTALSSSHIRIGADIAGGSRYNGKIDEVRFTTVVLTDTWISTEYNNQNSSSTFYTDGAQETARSFTLKRPPNNFLGLVARYTFDGVDMVSNIADSSGNANHGYLSGQTSTTTAIGKLGQALSFDGVNDYISIADNDGFTITSSGFTVSYWMKIDTIPPASQANRMFLLGKGTTSNFEWAMAINSYNTAYGKIVFELYNAIGSTSIISPSLTSPSVGRWYHVVATVAGPSSTANIYIDGVLDTGTTSGSTTGSNTTSNILLGARTDLAENELDGTLDDVRIYSRALSASEIKQLYNSAQSKVNSSAVQVVKDSLTGYWTFNGGDMLTRVEDKSGNARHGYLSGQTSTTTAIGKLGQALSFDGSNDVVNTNIALSSFISAGAGSVALWMKPDTTASSNANSFNLPSVVSDTGGFMGIHVGTVTGQGNKIWLYNWDGNEDRTGITYTSNEWIHVVWVNDSGTLRAYANGVATTTVATGNTQNLTGTVRMGRSFGNTYYDGLVDEVRTYNRALTPAEIKQLYLTGQVKFAP